MPPRHRAKPAHPLVGTWHIVSMENWDEDYIHMERRAFIEIDPELFGTFQFGLVSGELHGDMEDDAADERLEFTWEGNDEMDEASGAGWMRLKARNDAVGVIKIHHGDRSRFRARRARVRKRSR
jgi:hypothetical protein